MGRTLVFDLETDGLLDVVSKIHCLVIYDVNSKRFSRFDRDQVPAGLIELADAKTIIGHNILGYDLPVLRKLHPSLPIDRPRAIDTMVLARLAWPDIKGTDFGLQKKNLLPGNLIGSHSLKAYGYRLGDLKGTFHETTDWKEWSPAMSEYCENDVRVTAKLYDKLSQLNLPQTAVQLEHDVQRIIVRQMQRGITFDVKAAESLYADLLKQQHDLGDQLRSLFPPWYARKGEFTPKRTDQKKGYVKDATFTKVEYTEFNPASRQHIAGRLKWKYGWVPSECTDKGAAIVDEEVLSGLPYPEAKKLSEYLLLQKRIGQLADGDRSWLKSVDKNTRRIHGYVNSNGAVTGRMTHSDPNLAQVPRVGSVLGQECRSLFTAGPGMVLVGADASGIELRCLAHYLARYDGGAYAKSVVEGTKDDETDVHSLMAKALGLQPKMAYTFGGKSSSGRDFAKTFTYAWLYGAGDEKLGSIIGKGAGAGKKMKRQLYSAVPGLEELKGAVEKAARRGYLVGIDGRHIPVRALHSALNTLLQSAAALLMKKALVLLDDALQRDFSFVPGKDYEFVLNVHDEMQIETTLEKADIVGKGAVDAIRQAGVHFGIRVDLSGEYSCGRTWADTH